MTWKLSRVPSWAVAIAGAALVFLATAIGGIGYEKTSSERAKVASEASSLHARADRLWESHLQGDQRDRAASVFIALALSAPLSEDPKASQYAFDRAAVHLRGAFHSMWAAADLDAAEAARLDVAKAEGNLRRGDITAYNELSAAIDSLKLQSAERINELDEQARAFEIRAEILDDRRSLIYITQVCLNLLGLCLVMCKDLPLWRNSAREKCA